MNELKHVKGSCHCGSVAYEINGEMIKKSHCDCPACQKATGSDKAAFITINSASLRFTHKEPASYKKEDGVDCDAFGFWRYCPDCGSPLLWQPNEGDQRDILAGTLEDISLFTKN